MGLVYNVTKGRTEYLIGLDEGGAGGGGVSKKKIIIKSDTIPEASVKTYKLIYIYAGESNGTYHHGYIYECIADVTYDAKNIYFDSHNIGFDYRNADPSKNFTTDGEAMEAFLELVLRNKDVSFLQVTNGALSRKETGMWNVQLKDKDGNILLDNYQLGPEDLEDFGFVFLQQQSTYVVGEPEDFDFVWEQTSISNYRWEQLNVQPGSGGGDMSIYQLKANISQDPTSTSQGTYPSSYALSQAQKGNVKSVNFKEPDDSGNVLITQVATAENLVSPDNINDTAYILFRTAGGTKSINDGPATLMKIAGNVVNPRRSPNDIDTEHSETQRVTATVDATLFGTLSFVNNTSGTYTLSCNDVNDEPTWQYDDNGTLINVNLGTAGITLSSTAFVNDTMEIVYNHSDVEGEESYAVATYNAVDRLTISVDENVFAQKVNETFGVYTFLRQGTIWMINDSTVNISEYGITVTGTAQTGDTITVTYNGDMQVATPTSFQASGFNQFNPANVLSGYTINENGEIVSSAGSYVAYIHAVGGLENNYGNRHGDYTIYDDNTTGTLVRVGYSATIPTTSSTVTLSGNDGIEVVNKSTIPNPPADMLPKERLQWITFPKDGYICVALTDITKLCVHPTWSNYKDQDYAEYVAPSVIDIPIKGILIDDASHTMQDLPTYLAKVGNVYDEILFEDHRYQKRIDYLPYTEENLTTVQNKGVDYIYDSEAIYFVAEQPLTYIINFEVDGQGNPVIDEFGNVKLNNVNGQYIANDFGTEEFTGTTVAVLANTLYGNNLVDKLRTDVLTKSAQSLSQDQKEQVWQNLGLQPIYNHVNTLEPNATVTINLVPTKQVYELTPTSNTTLEFNTTNLTEFNAQDSDVEIEFTLYIKMVNAQQAWEITFPDTVVWGNTSPTMTAMANYKFSFCKPKGSSIWIGNQMYSWVE